jgi:hypothetical protein
MTPLAKPLNPAQLIAGLRARRGGRADFSDRGRQHVHPAARCGVMEWSLAAGVWVCGWAAQTCKDCGRHRPAFRRSPSPMRAESEQRAPNEPRGENVNRDTACACRCHYSQHRRHGIGRDQETKSPSQRPTGSGHRSAQRAAFQSIQSLAHRRRQPWLQSKPHDLEVEPAFQMPIPIARALLTRRARSSP